MWCGSAINSEKNLFETLILASVKSTKAAVQAMGCMAAALASLECSQREGTLLSSVSDYFATAFQLSTAHFPFRDSLEPNKYLN